MNIVDLILDAEVKLSYNGRLFDLKHSYRVKGHSNRKDLVVLKIKGESENDCNI